MGHEVQKQSDEADLMKSRVGQVWKYNDDGVVSIVVVIATTFSETIGPMSQPLAEHTVVYLDGFRDGDSLSWDEYQDTDWSLVPEMKQIA